MHLSTHLFCFVYMLLVLSNRRNVCKDGSITTSNFDTHFIRNLYTLCRMRIWYRRWLWRRWLWRRLFNSETTARSCCKYPLTSGVKVIHDTSDEHVSHGRMISFIPLLRPRILRYMLGSIVFRRRWVLAVVDGLHSFNFLGVINTSTSFR